MRGQDIVWRLIVSIQEYKKCGRATFWHSFPTPKWTGWISLLNTVNSFCNSSFMEHALKLFLLSSWKLPPFHSVRLQKASVGIHVRLGKMLRPGVFRRWLCHHFRWGYSEESSPSRCDHCPFSFFFPQGKQIVFLSATPSLTAPGIVAQSHLPLPLYIVHR